MVTKAIVRWCVGTMLMLQAAGCSAPSVANPPPQRSTIGVVYHAPAAQETRSTLGISRWHGIVEPSGRAIVLDGADVRGRVKFSAVIRVDKRNRTLLIESHQQPGTMKVDMKTRKVVSNTLGASFPPYAKALARDWFRHRKLVPYAGGPVGDGATIVGGGAAVLMSFMIEPSSGMESPGARPGGGDEKGSPGPDAQDVKAPPPGMAAGGPVPEDVVDLGDNLDGALGGYEAEEEGGQGQGGFTDQDDGPGQTQEGFLNRTQELTDDIYGNSEIDQGEATPYEDPNPDQSLDMPSENTEGGFAPGDPEAPGDNGGETFATGTCRDVACVGTSSVCICNHY
jgi:hypothetical protein